MGHVRGALWAYARLLRSPPLSLRSISFGMRGGFGAYYAVRDRLDAIADSKHWGELDAAVSRIPELTRFALVFNSHEDDGSMTEVGIVRASNVLEGALPKMVGKGVFAVEFNPRMNK